MRINLYRMTHIVNVPHILANGITHKDSPNFNRDYLTIGDLSLIDNRNSKTVVVDNGNFNKRDAEVITLGNYIPFYFGVRMPMLYVIQNGGNFVTHATPPEDIVYLVCSLELIIKEGHDFYFTDGHATDGFTSFYDKTRLEDLKDIIDWESVKAQFWSGQENLNVKRKKQAECLVQGDISPETLIGFGCFNQNTADKLTAMSIAADKIKIIPNAYF